MTTSDISAWARRDLHRFEHTLSTCFPRGYFVRCPEGAEPHRAILDGTVELYRRTVSGIELVGHITIDMMAADFNACARCDGSGLDPDGPGNGLHGSDYCRRCAGSGRREDGPT